MSTKPNTDLPTGETPFFVPPVAGVNDQEQRARNRRLIAALRAWRAEDTAADDAAAECLQENLNRNHLQFGKPDFDATDS
jgi:hypothetical protein